MHFHEGLTHSITNKALVAFWREFHLKRSNVALGQATLLLTENIACYWKHYMILGLGNVKLVALTVVASPVVVSSVVR